MRKSIQEYMNVPKHIPVNERFKQGLHLQLRPCDVAAAEKKNPQSCAIAKCAERVYGGPAAIYRRAAYFLLSDAKGKPFIAKMQGNNATCKKIRAFDRTGKMPTGGLDFIPVAESHTCAGRRFRRQKGYEGPQTGIKKRRAKTRKSPNSPPTWLRTAPKGMATVAARYSD
jgi:hypothetical protein